MKKSGSPYAPLNDLLGAATPLLYIGPTLFFVVVFVLFPTVQVLRFSFTDWTGFGARSYSGLANFREMWTDARFLEALFTNLIYVVFFSFIPILLGIALAVLVGRSRLRGDRFFRGVLLIPQVVAPVAMGVIFGWILAPSFGLVNTTLRAIGLDQLQQPWLGSNTFAPISVGLIGTWLWLGFVLIIFLSGIQKIDESLFDAAKLDGAGPLRQFTAITLPSLRSEIAVVTIVTLIRAFGSGVFGVVQAITEGSYRTTPVSLLGYKVAFVQGRLGYGSAIMVFLMLLTVLLSGLSLRLGEER